MIISVHIGCVIVSTLYISQRRVLGYRNNSRHSMSWLGQHICVSYRYLVPVCPRGDSTVICDFKRTWNNMLALTRRMSCYRLNRLLSAPLVLSTAVQSGVTVLPPLRCKIQGQNHSKYNAFTVRTYSIFRNICAFFKVLLYSPFWYKFSML